MNYNKVWSTDETVNHKPIKVLEKIGIGKDSRYKSETVRRIASNTTKTVDNEFSMKSSSIERKKDNTIKAMKKLSECFN